MEIKDKNKPCEIHVMPHLITDEDISALFNGIVALVKKKVELDHKTEFIHCAENVENLKRQLKEKILECNRLKNEIIHLKSKLN